MLVLNLPILTDRDLSLWVPHHEICILSSGDGPLGAEADNRGGTGAPNLCWRKGGNNRVKPANEAMGGGHEPAPSEKIYQGLLQVTDTKCRRDFRLIPRPPQRVI